jgi:vancomycin resistance protein VanJ
LKLTPLLEQGDSGYRPTWPMPLPVLTLDQMWSNPGFVVESAQGVWTTCSDHRPIIADVTIATTGRSTKSHP